VEETEIDLAIFTTFDLELDLGSSHNGILLCITHQSLSTYAISFKSENFLWMGGRDGHGQWLY